MQELKKLGLDTANVDFYNEKITITPSMMIVNINDIKLGIISLNI